MKKQRKYITGVLLALVCILTLNASTVFAGNITVDNTDSSGAYPNNRYLATGAGADIDHSQVTYTVDGMQAYCIEAGKPINKSYGTYSPAGQLTDARFSWIAYNVADPQLRQAAIWELAGNVGYGSRVINKDQAVDDVITQATMAIGAQASPANASANFEGGAFTYDRSTNNYISPYININDASSTEIQNDGGLAHFIDGNGANLGRSVGSGRYRLCIPASSVNGDMSNIYVIARGGGTVQNYAFPTIYHDGVSQHQKIIVPAMETKTGSDGQSNAIYLEAKCDLKVQKNDEYGMPVPNVAFKVTGPYGYQNTVRTDAAGKLELLDLRVGEYTFEEIEVGQNLYIKPGNKNMKLKGLSGRPQTLVPENDYKGTEEPPLIVKKDKYETRKNHGDQTLAGAVYELHAAQDIKQGTLTVFVKDELISTSTTNDMGIARMNPITKVINGVTKTFNGLPVGSYYWKEVKPSQGFLLNGELVPFDVENNTDMYTATTTLDPSEQEEDEILGRGAVVKMNQDNSNTPGVNDTTKETSEGAILVLISKNHPEERYEATIDAEGNCVFVDEEFAAEHPEEKYTIPFGDYTIEEKKEANNGNHTYFYMNKQDVTISADQKEYYFIVIDESFEVFQKIVKKDKDTDHVVHEKGGQYKIWDVKAGQFLTQMTYPSGEYTDVFETNANGEFITADKVFSGEYVIYEIKAPEGYYLNKEYRLPENEADYGKVGGVKTKIDKLLMGVADNTEYKDRTDLYNVVEIKNTPLKGKIEVYKEGEMLVSAKQDTTTWGETHTPIFEFKGLEGVTYNVIAAEDIKWPDEHGNYHTAGQVVDTFTTGKDGYGYSKDLYVGKYYVQEISCPAGYVVDNTKHEVTVENTDMYTEATVTKKVLRDQMKQLDLQVIKSFEDLLYTTSNKTVEKTAVVGVYANEDITNYQGAVVIHKNDLISFVNVKSGEKPVVEKLPAAKYYVKELDCSYPYEVNPNKFAIDLTYGDEAKTVIATPQIENKYDKATMSLLKISSSSQDNVVVIGDEIDTKGLDEYTAKLLNDIKTLSISELEEYIKKNEIITIKDAEFGIFVDPECTKPVYHVNRDGSVGEQAKFVTNENGLLTVDNLPYGVYYVKETKAPAHYKLSDKVTEVEVSVLTKNQLVYAVLSDSSVTGHLITKMDIFTSELIPNCEFEIAEKESGEVLVHAITNEEGLAYIPTDIFKDKVEYTYTELKAPEMYEIDKKPHDFTAEFDKDGNWITEPVKVYNLRNRTDVTLIKTDDEGNRVPDCVFELKSEETGFYEKGTTDKDGIYVFYNVPYGKYTYTELEAPAKYNIDTTPHEVNVYGKTMEIYFMNTGDIQVVAIAAMALVSALGVAFIARKKLVK